MVNSRQKGKRGEIEAAQALRANGIMAKRGVQYQGGEGSPDVALDVGVGLHVEVKRTEAFRLYSAMKQARQDAGEKIPFVLHRRSREPWVAIVELDNLIEFCKEVLRASRSDSLPE